MFLHRVKHMTLVEHLKERHIDLDLHDVWIDERNSVITFPLWNLSGRMCGFQQYRPFATKEKRNNPREGRYYTFHPAKTVAVWGLESFNRDGPIYVTEGIFDAARITEKGGAAVAVLCNNPHRDIRNWLNSLGRTLVAICDGGLAGRKLAKVGHEAVFMPEEYDLGDASEEEVMSIIEQYRNLR
jgi:hypothetical protein